MKPELEYEDEDSYSVRFALYTRVSFYNLQILDYYPYGRKIKYLETFRGECNLKKQTFDYFTSEQLVMAIKDIVSDAMYYLTIHTPPHPNKYTELPPRYIYDQRMLAFALHRLFHDGYIINNKEIVKNKTDKQLLRLYKLNHTKLHKINSIKYPNVSSILNKRTKINLPALKKRWKEYGLYEVRHMPLCPEFYTHQQLSAIYVMVTDAFENLC